MRRRASGFETRARRSPLAEAARRILARPGRLVAGALFASVAGYITLNALAFQTARHPAPLFAEPSRIVAAPAPRAVAVPPPAAAPAPSLTVELGPAPLPPARAPIAAAPAPPPAPAFSRDDDPIGALIRGGDTTTTASLGVPAPDLRVAAVQEALVALGHGPMTVDGLFGPATRAALESFERAEGLPVTGALDGATLRVLAMRSGVEID
ncbi:peptidoglycan-binding domain-containing protein [Salinarimonas chemoclinalis]|uniref:peptidoglycan-binding domain-containing protein n=1 Tax=Salinarimonas chemoclinalis TaxID=3241599 RepID=UPI003558B86F